MGTKLLVSRIELRLGYKIPRGWGIAYHLWTKDASIILPIPINIIVGSIRKFYYSLLCGWWAYSKIDVINEKVRDKAFDDGIKKGRELERKETIETVKETISEHIKRMDEYFKPRPK